MSAMTIKRLGFGGMLCGAVAIAPACSGGGAGGDATVVATDPTTTAPRQPAVVASPPALVPEPPGADAGPTCTPAPQAAKGAADVQVTVRADLGPNGFAKPSVVDQKIVGMNIADWRPQDYTPPDPKFLALLSALRPGVLRWPAGHRSQEYVWQRGGEGQHGNWTLTPAQVDAFVALANAVKAEPLLAINVKTGTPAAAADLVRYVNVDRAYGVKWFQVVNEPDLTDGIIPSPGVYAQQLIAFTNAMRAVDPNVKVVAPELLTGANMLGIHDRVNWLLPVLQQAGDRIDGISWHYYPLDSGQTNPTSSALMSLPHLFQETASDWRPAGLAFADEIMPALATLRDAHSPGASVWVTEFAEDPGPTSGAGFSDVVAGALWVGDALGRYARYGPGAVLRWLFKGSEDHAYGLLDPENVPRPTYGAYWLYGRHVGRSFVDATTSAITDVNVHAALRGDGALTVLLVNKASVPRRVHVSLQAFGACTADQLSLEGAGMTSKTFTINGHTLNAANADGTTVAPEAVDPTRLFEMELPPASMRLVAYRR